MSGMQWSRSPGVSVEDSLSRRECTVKPSTWSCKKKNNEQTKLLLDLQKGYLSKKVYD